MPFMFGVQSLAQALGDSESLDTTGRGAVLIETARRDGPSIDRVLEAVLTRPTS